ncbi:hypothetical protein CCM_00307 [Cordyceps militaris CM01]|uniref:Uncharacterized protein n=1 Tax=Cordyceps militaris (strain CM01) TaxID=983644 RepID=G3J3C3_CORMM|nr:uncharacterized protein CCM_00307 [Cordyceps militaris CM01]EGX95653.1 hypothetical protein CCM_00307 [Cordyceps militaris CM01]
MLFPQFVVSAALLASSGAAQTTPASSGGGSRVWQWRNYGDAKPVSPLRQAVTMHVPPDTDIWRPAADRDNFTAPFLFTTVSASAFASVQVTVTAPWRTLYDQGGLVLAYPPSSGRAAAAAGARSIKAGVEFTDGAPALGVVGTDILSDWSLSPIVDTARASVTVRIERQGTDAWVYVLENHGRTRRQLRQVTWAFNKDDGQGLASCIYVGIYGAKPTRESAPADPLTKLPVTFSDFQLNLREE